MSTFVDIAERQIEALDLAAKQRGTSREALVREAVDAFLQRNVHATRSSDGGEDAPAAMQAARKEIFDDAFGAWGDRTVDGLEYQRKLREEW